MATLEELQQQITALQQKVEALTTPPTDYYTHRWSGEEIDNAVDRSRAGGSIDASLSNKVNVGDTYGVTNQIATDLNIFMANQTVAFNETTLNRPPNFHFGTATIIGNAGWNIGTQIAISTSGQIATRYVSFENLSFGEWIVYASATPPQEYDLPLAQGLVSLEPCRYNKDQFGRVLVTIDCRPVGGSMVISESLVIATLPEGFRPTTYMSNTCTVLDGAGRYSGTFDVTMSGEIILFTNAPNASIIIGSIVFNAIQ